MNLSKIFETIASLQTVSDEERTILENSLAQVEKEFARNRFKFKRIKKDKSVAMNILNATIADLERKQLIIKEANEQLS